MSEVCWNLLSWVGICNFTTVTTNRITDNRGNFRRKKKVRFGIRTTLTKWTFFSIGPIWMIFMEGRVNTCYFLDFEKILQKIVEHTVGGEVPVPIILCGQNWKCPFFKTDSLEAFFFFWKIFFFSFCFLKKYLFIFSKNFCFFLSLFFVFFGHFFYFVFFW